MNTIILVKVALITLWTFFRMSVSSQRNSTISSFSESTTAQKRFIIFDDDKIKINKLDIYHENRNELNDWLTQVDVYFAFNQIINNKQILFAFIFLRERTKRWLKSNLRKYLDDEKNENDIFSNFDNFKKKIRRIFDIFNEKQTVERNIQHLTQRISAIDYVVRFQKQVNFIEWNNAAFMIMFRREFKNNVKNELIRWDEKLKNLNHLIEAAIELDDKLYEKIMKKRYDESREKTNIFIEHFNERREESRFNNRNHDKFNYYESMSMKLNFTQRRKRNKSFRNKQQDNRNNKKCYACDKSSHFARDCRSKKLMLQRQINATLRVVFETEKNWKKAVYSKNTETSKDNSNDDYYLIEKSKNLQQVLNETASDKISAITKEVNFIIKRIVRERSRTLYLAQVYSKKITSSEKDYEWDNELKEEFQNIMNRLKNLRVNQEKIIDVLKRLFDSDVSTKQDISTLNDDDHDLLNWTTCFDDNCNVHRSDKEESEWYFKKLQQYEYDIDECAHDDWRTCQNWQCEKHIIEKIEYRKARFHHEVLDWSICENEQCFYHQQFQQITILTRLKRRYLWLRQQNVIQAKKNQISW